MRALLVDPSQNIENFITEIEIENWRGIAPAIGEKCQMFTTVATEMLGEHTCYVDDEGLINGTMQDIGAMYCVDYPQPLAGRGVVLGIDYETGESRDCQLSIQDAQKIFGYPTPLGPLFRKSR